MAAARSITATEFHAAEGVGDWRVLLRRAEALFRAPSFAAGAALVVDIAAAADAADHHPDVALRYPGRVHVALTTHATGGLSTLDVEVARRISALARAAGCTVEPVAGLGAFELAVDALDIAAVRPFWRAVLGYVDGRPDPSGEPGDLVDPLRIGPPVWFQQMDAPRPQRNRLHVDISVPHDVAEARVAATVAAGGRVLDASRARAFWVLADPEGNEVCVCTWQDRD